MILYLYNNQQFLRYVVNAYVRLMLPFARKFVYDIAPKASIFSHDVEVKSPVRWCSG